MRWSPIRADLEGKVKRDAMARLVGMGTRTHTTPEKRMEDREFTEVDLRAMLEQAEGHHLDVVEGRWVIETRHRRHRWHVIVEPDPVERLLVVVTAYPVGD
jgi:hypothetical protein